MKIIKKTMLGIVLYFSCSLVIQAGEQMIASAGAVLVKNKSLRLIAAVVTVVCTMNRAVKLYRSKQLEVSLLDACEHNNTEMVELLLPRCTRAIINKVSANGMTALLWACKNNNDKIFELLLPHCTQETVNKLASDKRSCLYWACNHDNIDCVEKLISQCSQETLNGQDFLGYSPLSVACLNSNNDLAKLLVEHGADVETVPQKILLQNIKGSNVQVEEPADRDRKVESTLGVTKIYAVRQNFFLQNCSIHAIVFAYLLKIVLKNIEDFNFYTNDPTQNPFQSKIVFNSILEELGITSEFNKIQKEALSLDAVREIAAKVDPTINVVLDSENIEDFLNDLNRHQLFIYQKKGHFIALGVDHETGKIYLIDSGGYLNFKKEKYSSTDIELLSKIRRKMSQMKSVADRAAGANSCNCSLL